MCRLSAEIWRGVYSSVNISDLLLFLHWWKSFSFKWSIFQVNSGSRCQQIACQKKVFGIMLHYHTIFFIYKAWFHVRDSLLTHREPFPALWKGCPSSSESWDHSRPSSGSGCVNTVKKETREMLVYICKSCAVHWCISFYSCRLRG